jgi:flagellar basal-body rod protein FlgB
LFSKIFNHTDAFQKALDASALREQVIANNIANAETPNFKSSSVEFENLLQKERQEQGAIAAKRTHSKHLEFTGGGEEVEAVVVKNTSTTQRMDGNNVDIDYQNAQLAKNQIYYNNLIEKLNGEFRRLRMAIREGK